MGRKQKYKSKADKQRAYRERKAREKRNKEALLFDKKRAVLKSPPVRYFGAKWRIGSWIIDQFPPHTSYVEPFCGGAAILFRKVPSKFEIINDLNGDVVNFFDMLRSRTDELIRAIQLTPHARQEHKHAHQPSPDPIERARRFYVRSRQSFGSGEGRYNTGWRYQVNNRRGSSVIDEWNKTEPLWEAAARLKQVQIECDNALLVIPRFDTPETLFYVDPPYVHSERYSSDGYSHEMTDSQHRELAEVLQKVQGMVILSGYSSELYAELYSRWRKIEKPTRTNGNHQAIECLWFSPSADEMKRLPLFSKL